METQFEFESECPMEVWIFFLLLFLDTPLRSNAFPVCERNVINSLRQDAGHSLKSSISHSLTFDGRDSSIVPKRGYFVRTLEVCFILWCERDML